MKILCFYLPQFHETEDNNKWWEKGYTDWVAARRAVPRFKGHRQPRIPKDGRYYDLSEEGAETWKWQAELARDYGIYGFCIYHYWFNGIKQLEKPMEILLRHKEIDIRYTMCWANEAWERNWYGLKNEVLIPQEYGAEKEWEEHFYYMLPFFRDDRYIKVDGKPMFHIYHAHQIGCMDQMKSFWDNLARQNGFEGIYLVVGNTAGYIEEGSETIDAYYNFEPNHAYKRKRNKVYNKLYWWKAKLIHRYNKITSKNILENQRNMKRIYHLILQEKYHVNKKVYLGICPDYDDSPRRLEKGIVYRGASPKLFENALRKLVVKSEKMGNEYIYINAWNEWGEGAYMEPDEEYGYAYLEAVRRIMHNTAEK